MIEYAVETPPQHGTWQEFLDVWRATDDCEAFDQAWELRPLLPTDRRHPRPVP